MTKYIHASENERHAFIYLKLRMEELIGPNKWSNLQREQEALREVLGQIRSFGSHTAKLIPAIWPDVNGRLSLWIKLSGGQSNKRWLNGTTRVSRPLQGDFVISFLDLVIVAYVKELATLNNNWNFQGVRRQKIIGGPKVGYRALSTNDQKSESFAKIFTRMLEPALYS